MKPRLLLFFFLFSIGSFVGLVVFVRLQNEKRAGITYGQLGEAKLSAYAFKGTLAGVSGDVLSLVVSQRESGLRRVSAADSTDSASLSDEITVPLFLPKNISVTAEKDASGSAAIDMDLRDLASGMKLRVNFNPSRLQSLADGRTVPVATSIVVVQ